MENKIQKENKFQIEYISEAGVPSTSKIFALDETEVRKIFRRIYGDQSRIESVTKCEIRPVIAPLLEFE